MKNWTQAKKEFIKDHLSKPLKQPQRRLDALDAIERTLKEKSPDLLKDPNIFSKLIKDDFVKKYEQMKGKPLSSAEKSVITGLYKFSN